MTDIWWGETEFGVDDAKRWQLGGFALSAQRCAAEWKISFVRGVDPLDPRVELAVPGAFEPSEEATTLRFGYRKTAPHLKLMPMCADRPVIIRTAMPFFVPSGQDVTLYLSTSLWIQIFARDPKFPLLDESMYRPSDTWFGPSPRVGELCYSSKTRGRVHLENLELRPHRVVTEVRIRNRTETSLPVEKLRLPLPSLSVFAAKSGLLWTELVTLDRQADGEMAEVRLGKGVPTIAGEAKRVSPPRVNARESVLTRTFTGLLGLGGVRDHERVVE